LRQIDRPQDHIAVDTKTGETTLSRDRDRGAWRTTDTDVAYDATGLLEFAITPDDPLSARQNFTLTNKLGRDGWNTSTTAISKLTSNSSHFILESRLEAYEDEALVFERNWAVRFRRDQV
jgi:hypothetical protein